MTSPKADDVDQELLDRLTALSGLAVGDAARTTSGYTEDDDASEKRRGNADTRRTLHKIRRAFYWVLFWTMSATIIVCVAAYLYCVRLWLGTVVWGEQVHDAAALKSFIDNVLWSLLIIFATLFFEGAFKDRDS